MTFLLNFCLIFNNLILRNYFKIQEEHKRTIKVVLKQMYFVLKILKTDQKKKQPVNKKKILFHGTAHFLCANALIVGCQGLTMQEAFFSSRLSH